MNKSQFCRSLGLESRFTDLQWFDTTGYQSVLSYHSKKLVKFELNQNASSNFNGLKVSILNKESGVVDSKIFEFSDYLDTRENRADDRGPGKPHVYDGPFHASIKRDGGIDWYIAVPKDMSPFVDAVCNYTKIFW